MRIHTRNFGEIEFDETNQITFNEGIPGFRELKKYIIIMDKIIDEKILRNILLLKKTIIHLYIYRVLKMEILDL